MQLLVEQYCGISATGLGSLIPKQEHSVEIDLDTLSLKELKSLQAKITKTIENYDDRQKRTALTALEEKARELGFSLAELTGATSQRKRSAAMAKYANPANADDTWSGRGRKPRWFAEALESGASAESMAI